MYEIDEECVEGTLKIRVENSNSDYTNGFMKNSSLVKFPIVSIVPNSLMENNGKKLIETTTRMKRVEAKNFNRLGLEKGGMRWVKNSPEASQEKTPWSANRINQNDFSYPKEHKWTYHYCRHYWPLAGLFLVRRDNEKHEKDAVRHSQWKIDGNFTAEFPIRQKHKTKYIGSWASREIGLLLSPGMGLFYIGKTLINIYNEDQRSNHTKD